jgi:hypothetical protein
VQYIVSHGADIKVSHDARNDTLPTVFLNIIFHNTATAPYHHGVEMLFSPRHLISIQLSTVLIVGPGARRQAIGGDALACYYLATSQHRKTAW